MACRGSLSRSVLSAARSSPSSVGSPAALPRLLPPLIQRNRLFAASRVPSEIGCASSLLPLHGAVAIPRLTSHLSVSASACCELSQGCYQPFLANFRRCFSAPATNHLPPITDPVIEAAFKDLMAVNWDEIPDSVINQSMSAISKTTDDVAGKEVLKNVYCAAKASEEFGSTLVSLRMALDDLGGISGENVGRLPDGLEDAMVAAYKRYMTYLDSFSPDEGFLRKKVETELGTKMIHIKMRCSGIGSEWGKVSLLGTSGISGSYVEYRA